MNSLQTIDNKLASHPFLKGMNPEQAAILARHAREAEFGADHLIFRQGENAHQFHLILEGNVAVETYVARAEDIPLQILTAGDVLGWSWLFAPFTWHFQARSLEPTRTMLLDGANLLVACEQNHTFGYELMQRIAQVVISRLEATQKRLLKLQETKEPMSEVDEPRRDGEPGRYDAQSMEDRLAAHPFFEGMKAEHLRILADASMKSKFDAGEVIFREGDPANRFYLIEHGKVILEALGRERTAASFEIIADGETLGWSWLFPPYYSHFEARALERTQSISLYGTRLREECEKNHEFGYALLKRTVTVVIQRLQTTRERLVELSAIESIEPTNLVTA